MKYQVALRYDEDGNAWIPLPDELLNELGWKMGDTLSIEETLLGDYPGEVYGLVLEKVDGNSK